MNTNYEIQGVNSDVQVLRLASDLVDGDIVAIKATNTKPLDGVEVDTGHRVVVYPSYGGWIMAMPNGIISSAKYWRCTAEPYASWSMKDFNDSSWPFAVEYPKKGDCCPWRDTVDAWGAVNAQWLWTEDPVTDRTIYCRYTVNASDFVEGMDGSRENASGLAPEFNITAIKPGTSLLTIELNVTTIGALIYCVPINMLYRMRAPTAKEIQQANFYVNVTDLIEETWEDVTDSRYNMNIPPALSAHIGFVIAANMEGCREKCRQTPDCGRISFWIEGAAQLGSANSTNCQLLESIEGSPTMVTAVDATAVILHEVRIVEYKPQTIDIQDGLSAGTEYEVYCTAKGTDGSTTTQSEITARMKKVITQGCFNCGIQSYPIVTVRGGFVTSSRIVMIIRMSLDGKAYCMARPHDPVTGAAPVQPTEAEFRISSTIVPSDDELISDVMVNIQGGLQADSVYSFWCMTIATSGRGVSPEEAVAATRRVVSSSTLRTEEIKLVAEVSVTTVWCHAIDSLSGSTFPTIPARAAIRDSGVYFTIPSPHVPKTIDLIDSSRFTLDRAGTFEIYCDGEEATMTNETYRTPYPSLNIAAFFSSFQFIDLTINVDRAANISCAALPWVIDEASRQEDFAKTVVDGKTIASITLTVIARKGVNALVSFPTGGQTTLKLSNLSPGTLHDIYCFTADPIILEDDFIYTMPDEDMWATRSTVHTKGPTPMWESVECSAGRGCTVSGLTGFGLKPGDGLVVREFGTKCRVCECNGVRDPELSSFGVICIPELKPDPLLGTPITGISLDPMGPWCYVEKESCDDATESLYYPDFYISYQACQNPSVSVEGFEGFAKSDDGTSFTWYESFNATQDTKELIVTAPGGLYDLCWCADDPSITGLCTLMRDYSLYVGMIYVRGTTGLDGRNCSITINDVGGTSPLDRIAAIPGPCLEWTPATLLEYPGVPGFPNSAITLPLKDAVGYPAETFIWESPIFAQGGVYSLCWCGASESTDCTRRIVGFNFLQFVGSVRVLGPVTGRSYSCKYAAVCIIDGVVGEGLRGDDRIIASASDDCSVRTIDIYARTMQEYGESLNSIAEGREWYDIGEERPEIHEAWYSRRPLPGVDPPPAHLINGPVPERISVPGFPGDGRSFPSQVEGMYLWGIDSIIWPFIAGKYTLCWCGGGLPCTRQGNFNVRLGTLQVSGAFSLPPTSLQKIYCVTYEKCEVRNLLGKMSPGDRLMITEEGCGAEFAPVGNGAPNRGVSLPSVNGRDYEFSEPTGSAGGEAVNRITLAGGRYFLCWCNSRLSSNACLGPQSQTTEDTNDTTSVRPNRLAYSESASFDSIAGILLVKSPVLLTQAFFCVAKKPCTIGPLEGHGLSGSDRVKVTASCAPGVAGIGGFPQGAIGKPTTEAGVFFTWGTEPLTAQVGQYRLCWSSRTSGGTYNYIVDIGSISVAGPQPNQVKNCYERLKCTVTDLKGTGMKDGDVLIALWDTQDECEDLVAGTPERAPIGNEGMSYPATNGGRDYAFSDENDPYDYLRLPILPPLFFKLCWVENGDLTNGSIMQAGIMNVRPSGILSTYNRVHGSIHRYHHSKYGIDDSYRHSLAHPAAVLFMHVMQADRAAGADEEGSRHSKLDREALAAARELEMMRGASKRRKRERPGVIAEVRHLRRAARLKTAAERAVMREQEHRALMLLVQGRVNELTAKQLADIDEPPAELLEEKTAANDIEPAPSTRESTPPTPTDPYPVPPVVSRHRQRQHAIATASFPIHKRIPPEDRMAWSIARVVDTDKIFPRESERAKTKGGEATPSRRGSEVHFAEGEEPPHSGRKSVTSSDDNQLNNKKRSRKSKKKKSSDDHKRSEPELPMSIDS
ncbi:hypothetical protein FOL47_007002 [Perkinsus chesapeaki]|uniref:Uncharacterized protein n=1 Tax=Perkinsus chesapeaki TaxID=330153 RepID=A0A7J6MWF2_PERCH|nr:hypothetical protein FOL47_007002 [Perkinsus chesapeaki]